MIDFVHDADIFSAEPLSALHQVTNRATALDLQGTSRLYRTHRGRITKGWKIET